VYLLVADAAWFLYSRQPADGQFFSISRPGLMKVFWRSVPTLAVAGNCSLSICRVMQMDAVFYQFKLTSMQLIRE
jgi:hypothetical protein